MKDYIEREQAITVFKTFYGKSLRVMLEALEEEHAVDVREVVLCRDCDCGKDCYIKTILTEDCEVEEPFCAAGKPGCGADMREES